jgi:hypothetical protein
MLFKDEEDKISIVFMDGELYKTWNGQTNLKDNYTVSSGLPR